MDAGLRDSRPRAHRVPAADERTTLRTEKRRASTCTGARAAAALRNGDRRCIAGTQGTQAEAGLKDASLGPHGRNRTAAQRRLEIALPVTSGDERRQAVLRAIEIEIRAARIVVRALEEIHLRKMFEVQLMQALTRSVDRRCQNLVGG